MASTVADVVGRVPSRVEVTVDDDGLVEVEARVVVVVSVKV
jgi:hypothetical protein